MFDNIAKLRFVQGHSGEPTANAMISAEGEMMEFRAPVVAEGKVEDWMTEVLGEMRRTNRLITKESIFRYLDGMTRSVVYCRRRVQTWPQTTVQLYMYVYIRPLSPPLNSLQMNVMICVDEAEMICTVLYMQCW